VSASPSTAGAARAADTSLEEIIDPSRAIIDPHHHLWDRRRLVEALPPPTHPFEFVVRRAPLYLLDELLEDTGSGHAIKATVYVECGSMYRADGPSELRPVGETAFVNGVAAMSASGTYGDTRVCAGIIGHVDLRGGGAVRGALEAHLAAGGGRFRGVRQSASFDKDSRVLGPLARAPEGLYRDGAFRAGYAELEALGLCFDAWLLEPQLEDLIGLARAFPNIPVILDHLGTPLGIGAYAGRRQERFPVWADAMRRLAALPNVVVKLGGLAMPFAGFERPAAEAGPASAGLAALWRPYVETGLDAFGPDRCMFESNFPVDRLTCSYRVLWNALKRIAAPWSEDEKDAVFSGTARRVYGLEV
jgi:predicted TIM-barrel fold metal-dependent hydrolase